MVNVDLKIDGLLGHRTAARETAHRVIRKIQEKDCLLATFLLFSRLHRAS
jgi:hypothetical protein